MAALADSHTELSRIVRQVFTDMTPLDVRDEAPEPWASSELFRASVRMNGAWSGHLDLFSARDFVTQVAAILIGKHPSDVGSSDAREVWGELANVIAGHTQHDLPEPKSLGAPVVTTCDASSASAHAGIHAWMVVEGVPVLASLHVDEPTAASSSEEGR